MKMKRICKKIIARVLIAVMLISVFSTVDMGWNVMEMQAADNPDSYSFITREFNGEQKVYTPNCMTYKRKTNGDIIIEPIDYDPDSYFFKYSRGMSYDAIQTIGIKKIKITVIPPSGYDISKMEVNISGGIDGFIALDGNGPWYIEIKDNNYQLGNNGYDKIYSFTVTYHTHSYSASYSYDANQHYKVCSSCGAKSSVGDHSGGSATCTAKATCSTCKKQYGDLKSDNHDWTDTSWKKDANNHWHACNYNSSHTKDVASHSGGTATCTQKATCSKCGQSYGDFANHVFSYSANDNVITATCSRSGCSYNTNGITLSLSADNAAYTGSPYTGASIGDWSVSPSPSGLGAKPTTITYTNKDGTAEYNSTTAPTNVGDYTASITVSGKTATKDFSITKKNIATDDVEITRGNAVYDATEKPAIVTPKSSVSGMGDIAVKYQKKNGSDWDAETADAPVNAGTYKVIAYVPGGNNFNESHVAVEEFTISKAPTTITTTPSYNDTISYGTALNEITLGGDGVAQSGGTDISGTFAWKIGTTKPVVADSGNEKFTIVFTPTDSNNYASSEKNVAFTVNKAHPAAPAPGVGYKVNYEDETLKAFPPEDFEISSSNGEDAELITDNKFEPGGTYYVRYKKTDDQDKSDWTPITIPARPAAPNASDVKERTDKSITIKTLPGVEYSIDGGNTWITGTNGEVTFSGLTQESEYKVQSRVKATDTAPHGEETEQRVMTKKALPDDLTTLFNYTAPEDGNPTYNKQPKEAEVTKDTNYPGIGTPVIKYYDKDGNEVKNPTDAGEYTVKVSVPATDDYPAVPETKLGTFSIAQKKIKISGITANNKEYDGTTDATLDYSNVVYNGIITGDSLTVTATGTFEDANVGNNKNVAITNLVLGGVSIGNYILDTEGQQASAEASITPKTITADMVTLTKYKFVGNSSPINVAAGGNLSVKYKDATLTEDTDYELEGNVKTAIDDYEVTIKGIGNFTGEVKKPWRITKTVVPVEVTNPSITIKYGEVPIINIEDKLSTDKVTYGPTEDSIEDTSINVKDVGTHTIWVKVYRDDNYEPYVASIVLEIEPKELTADDIIWGETILVYNGKTQAPIATVKSSSLLAGDTCKVITSSTAKNVGIGYTATATSLSNSNYKLSAAVTSPEFEITPKSLTLKARNASKYVGAKDPVLTYDAVGICSGDTLSGVSVARDSGESVGSYQIRVSVDPAADNKNYTITMQSGVLVIKNHESNDESSNGNSDGGSNGGGNNSGNTIPVVPVQKPVVLPIDALTANAANKNTKNTVGNNKGANLGADGTNAETDDSLGANGAGNLTLHLEVSEHSPIETASIETPVTKLLEGSDVFTTEEALAIKGGVDARVWVHIDKLDMSVVPDSVHDEILSAAKGLEDDNVELLYFDISLFKQIGDGEIVNIHEPGTHIEITLELPESVINTDDKVVREYKILRLHDGVIDVIPTTYNPDTQTISFATDKFSTYVLAYIDTPADAVNTENAASTDEISVSKVADDASSLNVWLFIIPVIIIAGIICAIIIYRKKREDDMTV